VRKFLTCVWLVAYAALTAAADAQPYPNKTSA
jgi:hypothetical protein